MVDTSSLDTIVLLATILTSLNSDVLLVIVFILFAILVFIFLKFLNFLKQPFDGSEVIYHTILHVF